MVHSGSDPLKKVSAWPTAVLMGNRQGSVVGFLMPRIDRYRPIHELYSPAHRKQSFPEANWAFLLSAARNVAAAFSVIHAHGHVIGDVNQGNIMVSDHSLICLIDCDSFQILDQGRHHRCEVGVAHFTPPELQTLKSFADINRTPQHDAFGLALICFHLLFLGRHPFAGVYSGREDMPIERAITEVRFPYGAGAHAKGMSPPPNSVGLDIVPARIGEMFERAFSEEAARKNIRPSANDWISALDDAKGRLRTCSKESAHIYFSGLTACPWCLVEQKSGTLFFIGVFKTETVLPPSVDIAMLWQKILQVPSPGPAPAATSTQFLAVPQPLPHEIASLRLSDAIWNFLVLSAAAAVAIGGSIAAPSVFFIWLILALLITGARTERADKKLGEERSKRRAALQVASQTWSQVYANWNALAGDKTFLEKRRELEELRTRYDSLGKDADRDLRQLEETARERQRQRYLDQFFIDQHEISGIGAARKATLASFGIETAADITEHRIQSIKGFGPWLASRLLTWRSELERGFRFDPKQGVDPRDLIALKQRYAMERQQLAADLATGLDHLNQLRLMALRHRQILQSRVEEAGQQLAQANADATL